jgi:hypothetical protein
MATDDTEVETKAAPETAQAWIVVPSFATKEAAEEFCRHAGTQDHQVVAVHIPTK